MNWNEYYDSEMEKIEKTKKHLEKAFIVVIILFIIANTICALAGCFI